MESYLGRKKVAFTTLSLEKGKTNKKAFELGSWCVAAHVAKDAEKWVLLSGMHQSMTENWNLQLFISGCYLCVAKSWMPWLHLPPSPKPQKPQPNRHVPSHPSKTVLLFEVTVPLVVGRSLVYLFILVPIARTPASHAACFCAWPNAVNISQGGERAERARTAEPPSAAAPWAEERPAAGEDTGSKQTCSPAVWLGLAFPVSGCLDMMCACDVSLLPNFCYTGAVPWLSTNHSTNCRCGARQIPTRGGALCFKFLSLVLCRLFPYYYY